MSAEFSAWVTRIRCDGSIQDRLWHVASASAPKGGAGVFPFPAQEKTSKRRIRIHKDYPCDPPSRLTTLYWDMAHKKGEVDVSQLILKRWSNKGAEHRLGTEISEVFRDYWKEQDKL